VVSITPVRTPAERRDLLKAVYEEAKVCVACPLHVTRTKVVFGSGNADADLMFIGEGPGANEDLQGLPFVGQAGKLLDKLLDEIGISRQDVFIANCVKCRPPGNRDPHPHELDSCRHFLFSQLDLIEPTVVCTLGNFSTKLIRGEPTGISRIHGQPEVRVIGPRAVRLYPLYHPAAALYTPSTLEMLRADFQRIPELLALGAPAQPEPVPVVDGSPEPETSLSEEGGPVPPSETGGAVQSASEPSGVPAEVSPDPPEEQLGLF
jgi:uracil-DNA glycosylase family 4